MRSEQKRNYLKGVNSSIKSTLQGMSVKEVDTLQPDTQFALIGQAKKAMNSYIQEYY